jgi:RNA polymerase sigma-70 factor (ECF subfamily)
LASERELNDFLKSVEKRAFKRALYNVRNEESALDIVQDSMMRLSIHYGDRNESELQPLFQRILSNAILDWFRRQKTHNSIISNFSDLEGESSENGDFDILESLLSHDGSPVQQSAESQMERYQALETIESEIKELPQRQREAFLLRYWEDMDVAETAETMGCTTGSVKTHCFRAIQTLAKALNAKGMKI